MKKLLLFLVLINIQFLYSQPDDIAGDGIFGETVFPYIGWGDWNYISHIEGSYRSTITMGDYYYEELSELGLSHVVTLGNDVSLGADNFGFTDHPNGIPILDINFQHRIWTDDVTNPFFAFPYIQAQGNAPDNKPYHFGGARPAENIRAHDNNWGYGAAEFETNFIEDGAPQWTRSELVTGENVARHVGAFDDNLPHGAQFMRWMQLIAQYHSRGPNAATAGNPDVEYIIALNMDITDPGVQLLPDTEVLVIEVDLIDPSTSTVHDLTDLNITVGDLADLGFQISNTGLATVHLNTGDFRIRKTLPPLEDVDVERFDMRFRIGSRDNCIIDIDHISFYDTYYEDMFITSSAPNLLANINQHFDATYDSFDATRQKYTQFYIDEPKPSSYRAVAYANDEIAADTDPTHQWTAAYGALGNYQDVFLAAALDEYIAENDETRLPYVMADRYPFTGQTSFNDTQAGVFDRSIQDALDDYIEDQTNSRRGLERYYQFSRGYDVPEATDTRLISIIQSAARHVWDGPNNNLLLRAPRESEIMVQGWLSVCYGAKGLGFFTIHSSPPETTPTGDFDSYYGLFDSNSQIYTEDFSGGTWTFNNLTQVRNTGKVMNERYDAVERLISDMRQVDDVLLDLNRGHVYSINNGHNTIPDGETGGLSSEVITGIETYEGANGTSGYADNEDFVELGFFTHNTTNEDYVVVVNRRCELNNAAAEYDDAPNATRIECTLNNGNSAYRVEVVGGDEVFYVFDDETNRPMEFSISLPPGSGALLRITPYNYQDITESAEIINTPTVPSGTTLSIDSGSEDITLTFNGGDTLIVEGSLSINETSSGTVTFDFSDETQVGGIWIDPNADCDINNVEIQNSQRGITYKSDETSSINNVIITDCYSGIYCFSGTNLTINEAHISDCTWGIALDQSNIVLEHSLLGSPMTRGIYLVQSNVNSSYSGGASNTFSSINTAFYATTNSTVRLGECSNNETNSHLNCISNGTLKGYSNSSTLLLDGNFWDPSSSPTLSEFTDFTSTISIDGDRGVCPSSMLESLSIGSSLALAGSSSPAGLQSSLSQTKTEKSDELKHFLTMLDLINGSNVSDALIEVDEFLILYPESHMIPSIFQLMLEKQDNVKSSDISTLLTESATTADKSRLQAELDLLTAYQSPGTALAEFTRLSAESNPEEVREAAMYGKIMWLENMTGDGKAAEALLKKFRKEFPESEYNDMLAFLFAGQAPTSAGKAAPGMKMGLELEEKAVEEVEAVEALPEEYQLYDAYPNPFNPSTTIRYALPFDSFVKVSVFDINGNLIRELQHGNRSAGYYETVWDGRNDHNTSVVSGVYIYRIDAVSQTTDHQYFSESRKMILVK